MKIQNISSKQQTYKGYVDKSFTNYVKKACKNECMNILERANKYDKKVDAKEIFSIKSFADNIISKFSKYMDYLESHTSLNMSHIETLSLNNPISNKGITFTRPMLVEEKPYVTGHCIISPSMYNNSLYFNSKEAGRKELNLLDKMADDLKNIDYEEVDKSFLKFAESELKSYAEKNGANFIKRLKSRKMAKKIDNYAQRIDMEPVNKVRVEEYIRKAKEQKATEEKTKLEIEQLKKENIRIVNDILNGK